MKLSSVDQLNQWVNQSKKLWLFLDYDGTLKEFTRTPDILQPDPKLIDTLQHLSHKSKVRVAIITGRRLQDIRTLLPIQGLFFAATYGLELQTPDSECIQREDYDSIRPYLEELIPQWQKLISGHQGFYLEDKRWALALHARFAPNQEASRILSLAEQLVNQHLLKSKYRLTNDNKFLEISSIKANKAKTVHFLLTHYPLPDAKILYVGDDKNDSQAFDVVHSFGGIAIAVAHYFGRVQAAGADFVMKSPKATRTWLENLRQLLN